MMRANSWRSHGDGHVDYLTLICLSPPAPSDYYYSHGPSWPAARPVWSSRASVLLVSLRKREDDQEDEVCSLETPTQIGPSWSVLVSFRRQMDVACVSLKLANFRTTESL